jgi:hypothetical protein
MNAVLEIVIGLGFVFLIFSLMTSALVEWLSAFLDRRAQMLRDALGAILGDELARDVLLHPAITGLAPNDPIKRWASDTQMFTARAPNYLSPPAVALALAELAGLVPANPPPPVDSPAGRLSRLVVTLGGGGAAELQFRLERWFREQMERTSGKYKRWTQLWMIGVATTLTIGLDIDAGRIASELKRNAVLRTALAERAENALVGKTIEQLKISTHDLEGLPIGRVSGRELEGIISKGELPGALLGWFITIVALSLGAPFWFDFLNRLINFRQTGARPSGQMEAQ